MALFRRLQPTTGSEIWISSPGGQWRQRTQFLMTHLQISAIIDGETPEIPNQMAGQHYSPTDKAIYNGVIHRQERCMEIQENNV